MSHSIVTRIVVCDDPKLLGMTGLAVYQSASNPKEAHVGCKLSGSIFLGVTMTPLISKRSAQAVVVDGVVEAQIECIQKEKDDCGILPIGYPISCSPNIEAFKDCQAHALFYRDSELDKYNEDMISIAGIFIQSTGKKQAIIKLQPNMKLMPTTQMVCNIGGLPFKDLHASNETTYVGPKIIDSAKHVMAIASNVLTHGENKEQFFKNLDLSKIVLGPQIADALLNKSSTYYKEAHKDTSSYTDSLLTPEVEKEIEEKANYFILENKSFLPKKPTENPAKKPKIAGRK
jgi:hypothetical protein